MLTDLRAAVRQHTGSFVCEQINNARRQKVVPFAHIVADATPDPGVPEFGRLRDFYRVFGGIVLYADQRSGDAARNIVPSGNWPELHEQFMAWIDDLEGEEREEIVPAWIDTCLVVGETPRTGNYILVPTDGPMCGRIFEFDHDGFEFTEKARDIVEYVQGLLDPDEPMLTNFASHMRFIDGDPKEQWWIREMKDNRGNVVSTRT